MVMTQSVPESEHLWSWESADIDPDPSQNPDNRPAPESSLYHTACKALRGLW